MLLSERMDGEIVRREWHRPSRQYDIIVAGLGCAGAIAAITAARRGLSVLGIELLHCMGGTALPGAVYGYYFGSEGGLYEEIDRIAYELGKTGFLSAGSVNPEAKKYLLEQEAKAAGVTVLYDSQICGVLLDGHKVSGLRWFGEQGMEEAGAHVVIDATADALICTLAGGDTALGRKIDGQSQPYSAVITALRNGRVCGDFTDNGYVDQTNGSKLSDAIITSNTMPCSLREHYEENDRMLSCALLLGLREGKHIIGEQVLTFADFIEDRTTCEPLFYAYMNLDNHGKDIAFESEAQQDWTVACSLWGVNFFAPVPLGALIPKGCEGLLAAGRHLAVDHDMAPAVRSNRDMQKCGEAAAAAAVVAIQKDISLRDVPYADLLPLLKEYGCLNDPHGVKMKNSLAGQADALNPVLDWITDPDEMKAGLASDGPGLAIWSAKRLGAAMISSLKSWLTEENQNLSRHSAFALSLQNDKSALPVLRRIVRERDGFVPNLCRKYNQIRAVAAIYLLGRMRDTEIVPELFEILCHPESITSGEIEADEFIGDRDEYYFQYFSHALCALLKIGAENPQLQAEISKTIADRIFSDDFSATITLKGGDRLKFDMTAQIRSIFKKSTDAWKAA